MCGRTYKLVILLLTLLAAVVGLTTCRRLTYQEAPVSK